MRVEYTIERAKEYNPMPHHLRFYTPEERASGSFIVFSNDGDSALCNNMDEVLDWIRDNAYSRGLG